MARRAQRVHPRRLGAVTVVGLTLAAGAAGCGTPAVSNGPHTNKVLVCESGIQTHGGVRMSSAVAVLVPDGTPVPPGCRLT